MKFSRHARAQAQRRGIDAELVELVIDFGEAIKARGGARMYRVRRADLGFVEQDCPPLLWRRYRDRIRSIAPVVGRDNVVVTAMHRYKALWRRKF